MLMMVAHYCGLCGVDGGGGGDEEEEEAEEGLMIGAHHQRAPFHYCE